MKKFHLISNAHIDPVWQWEWEEGAAAAVSTFRCAASFCREFDGYIFCHNESLIYRWIEEYEPSLFDEIQELVKLGKWHIMGGWHVQPDCNLPSGEAFARQIAEGRKYFKEKFGKAPTTAINFDPFGHTRGLVQIMAKSGYDSYLFCRPDSNFLTLPDETFTWVGYDGSKITGQRAAEGYGSGLGQALNAVRSVEGRDTKGRPNFRLWGVGDHGGGPSRMDIAALNGYIAECREKGIEVLHSTPEDYFADVRAYLAEKGESLPEHKGDLNLWAPGCYTSQVLIKQKYRQTENMLFSTEKMYTQLTTLGRANYPEKEFGEVLYDMLTVQFHDILPGSSVRPAEEMAVRMLDHALEILSRLRTRAFFALAENQPAAVEGEIPVLVYNPHPYEITGDFDCEFMLADQNWSNGFTMPSVYQNDVYLPSQCEKENSNIPLDWRKRVTFRATLSPMAMNRFDVRLKHIEKRPVPDEILLGGDDPEFFVYKTPHMTVEIDRKSGLLHGFSAGGTDYLGAGACGIDVMQDLEDAWGMTKTCWKNKIGAFRLLSTEESTRFSSQDQPLSPIRIIEDGDVRTVVEVTLGYERSRAVLRYKLSKHAPTMDVDLIVHNCETRKMFKLALPIALSQPTPSFEVAFGEEPMRKDSTECVGHKYITVTSPEGGRLTIDNQGTYGASYENGLLYITLLHSPGYTTHPLGDRHVLPTDRWTDHMEQGERRFSFRITAGQNSDTDMARKALSFNEAPIPLSFFPKGGDTDEAICGDASFATLSGNTVVMTALKPMENGLMVRLFNPLSQDTSCTLACPVLGISTDLSFTPYEAKTLKITPDTVVHCPMDELL